KNETTIPTPMVRHILTSRSSSYKELTISWRYFSKGGNSSCLKRRNRLPSSSYSSSFFHGWSLGAISVGILSTKLVVRSKSMVANWSPSVIVCALLVRLYKGQDRYPLKPGSTCGPVPRRMPL